MLPRSYYRQPGQRIFLPSAYSAPGVFDPRQLFAAGEQGAWYDPSDLTTLFQDGAGTTPVTAVEQPVRLMLDKRIGITAIGADTVVNGAFAADSDWTKGTGWTIGSGVATKAAGTAAVLSQAASLTAGTDYLVTYTITRTAGTLTARFTGGTTVSGTGRTADGTYTDVLRAVSGNTTLEFSADSSFAGTVDNVTLRALPAGNHAAAPSDAARPVLRGRVNLLDATTTLATQSVTVVAAAHTLRFTGAGTITLSGTASGTFSAGTHSITPTAGSLTLTVSGTVTDADLRVTNDGAFIPPYQRVTTSTDYDTAGFPLYLAFDGTDDSMSTGSIDFSAGDKMTVFAGIRKLSDTLRGMVMELSTSSANAGTFSLEAPDANAVNRLNFFYTGATTSRGLQATNVVAPVSSVATASFDLGAPLGVGRLNGAQYATNSGSTGGGNFGSAYPLFIGSRNNASIYFNGRLYSLIVRGAESNAAQIAAAEAWVNGKTRAY
jgi:hypothetical protein